ncbi:LysR family transcriptional regulator (plasmid) [Diaphorobacter sp. HDW4B]|uniref:LysR family transcriptional regulator n=1 Tax=Diaphorobacter sp. HDW4B TaxID=2714925 RepID=UPI00140DD653|nr:LysR family transcriptional regulator [Diaphorobacter sp. HDW4B]QIL74268.1 LysR family transcriptional regulator [Diaphorobacter sp. HDW4B]
MDSFSDLTLFAQIAKLGSMAAAAQELGVTPPVVSRRLAALEARLGVRLLNRTTRRSSLTPEGEQYLNDGARILEELSALESRLGGGTHQPMGTIRIGATLGFGRMYIAPVLSKFTQEFPQVEVQLHLTDRPINLVEQGFDLVIRFGEQADSRLTARLLANNRRLLCAAPSYLKKLGVPATPRELGKHNCIFIREGDETYGTWYLRRAGEVEAVKVRSNLSSNDGTAALGWAIEGRGILLRSQWDIAEHLRSKRLVPVLGDWSSPPADVYAVFQATKQMPAKIRTMVDRLVDAFEPWRRRAAEPCGPW